MVRPGGPARVSSGSEISFGVARGTLGFLVNRDRDE